MSLLSICQNACDNIGITKPTAIIGNIDPGAQRLLQMARREANNLSTRTNWVSLVVEHVFIANGTSDYLLPPDFRSMINNTLWDRSRHWRMRGAMSPQQWQFYKSSIFGRATIERRWRLRVPTGQPAGSAVQFEIDPSISDTSGVFVFEYVSENWCQSTTAFEVIAAVPATAGTGYLVGDTIVPIGGTLAAPLIVTSLADVTAGGIGTLEVVIPPVFATPLPINPIAQSSTSGVGTGATFDLTFAGKTQADWVADSDVSLLDEDLIELGVIWRTLRRLGLSYEEEQSEYENQVRQSVARDGGTAIINLAPQRFSGDYNFVGSSPGVVLTADDTGGVLTPG